MTPPENDRPEDEDGGTFKLKPGAAAPGPAAPGPAAPGPDAASGEEPGLDRTMKIQRVEGEVPAAPAMPSLPPPPPSPLGNPTGPAEPPAASFAETTVMPQQAGSQTGFQPAGQPTPPPGPLGSGQLQPPPGYPQQGQPQPYPGPPPQQGYPQAQPGPQGPVPPGIQRIGLMAMIGSGIGLISSIAIFAALGGFYAGSAVISLLFALAFGWYGYALPKGQIASSGLRLTGIILMMIGAGGSILSIFTSFGAFALFGGLGAILLLQSLALAGVYGYGSFIYFKDESVKAFIRGPQTAPAGYPPPGYGQQPPPGYGQPQQPPPGYGQPQQPPPGAYPPPPPGYGQQQPPQAPYGG